MALASILVSRFWCARDGDVRLCVRRVYLVDAPKLEIQASRANGNEKPWWPPAVVVVALLGASPPKLIPRRIPARGAPTMVAPKFPTSCQITPNGRREVCPALRVYLPKLHSLPPFDKRRRGLGRGSRCH